MDEKKSSACVVLKRWKNCAKFKMNKTSRCFRCCWIGFEIKAFLWCVVGSGKIE